MSDQITFFPTSKGSFATPVVVRGLNRFKFGRANLPPLFLSDARPSNGAVATRVNKCFHRFSLMSNNYAGCGVVVGNWANFLYTLIAFPFVYLRQLRTLPQTMSWVATTPTYMSWFPGVRITCGLRPSLG